MRKASRSATTTAATEEATAQSGNGCDDEVHCPYVQFELACTTPVFGLRPAATTTASIASPRERWTIVRPRRFIEPPRAVRP
jgi:hypothetical protein